MRLRRSCQHNRYEEHKIANRDEPHYYVCPGGAFVDVNSLAIENVGGHDPWQLEELHSVAFNAACNEYMRRKGSVGIVAMYHALEVFLDVLTDRQEVS